jgi:hypothetical protein
LIYEHYHLGRADAAACRAELQQAGYSVMSEGLDTFCVLEGPEDELAKAWRGLRPAIPPAFAEGTG